MTRLLLRILPAVFLLTGCSLPIEPAKPDATRYYVLGGVPAESEGTAVRGPVIGLKRVEAAAYLRGKTLVVRVGDNEVKYIEDARWAEPLEAAAKRLLGERLAKKAIVRMTPFTGDAARAYDLSVHLLQCEGTLVGGGRIQLSAAVEITGLGAGARPTSHHVIAAKAAAWDGKDYARLAQLLGEGLDEIADRIMSLLPPEQN